MKKIKLNTLLPIVAVSAVLTLAACDQRESTSDAGPAESTGQRVDDALSRAGEKVGEVTEKTGKNLENLGERLKNEAAEAKEAVSPERDPEPASITPSTDPTR